MSKEASEKIAAGLTEALDWVDTNTPHDGGEYPVHPLDQIKPVYRGPARPEGVRITNAPAQSFTRFGTDPPLTKS